MSGEAVARVLLQTDKQIKEAAMPRGSKAKYTNKQKRQAEYIKAGYKERGVPEEEAESRAWATVNRMSGGGKKPGGSGYGKKENKEPAKKGGRIGAAASADRPAADKSASARKAARTRARNNKAARSAAARKGAKRRTK
jgi:hypothetical protein